ncbi:MAG: branched-chain amino acid ABC transporter permease [Armatimonadetes bacterium]|nr:branched-chain amino acid ABC transporter permease [Armatimonadota bacterium]
MQEFLQQVINGIAWGGVYALIALGYTMVYGVLRLINFAHGDVYMFGAFMAFYASMWIGPRVTGVGGVVLVILFAILASVALGVVIERFAYRPVRHHPRLTALITAIGVSLLLENGGQQVFGADPQPFPSLFGSAEPIQIGGLIIVRSIVYILVCTTALLLLLQYIVMYTRFGKAMRAISQDPTAAALMGINIDNVITATFALGSALAAAAGLLVASYNPQIDPYMGLLPGLKAFAAAVVGGIGSIPGAVIGGLVLGLAEVFVGASAYGDWREAIAFALLIVILLVKPSGLLGTGIVEKV